VALVFIPETSNGDFAFAFFRVKENTVPFSYRTVKIVIFTANFKKILPNGKNM
jgi:hypothetical protein